MASECQVLRSSLHRRPISKPHMFRGLCWARPISASSLDVLVSVFVSPDGSNVWQVGDLQESDPSTAKLLCRNAKSEGPKQYQWYQVLPGKLSVLLQTMQTENGDIMLKCTACDKLTIADDIDHARKIED